MEMGSGQRWGPISYAQHGDDLFIINLFELIGIDKPSYLDLGANHPFHISNTALLYQRGSRGINIDANPHVIKTFDIHRPGDMNINIAIGFGKEMTFKMFDKTSGLNTFSEKEVKKLEKLGMYVNDQISMPTISLNTLIENLNIPWPDFLNVDLEGMDYEIMKNTRIPRHDGPSIICIETRRHETRRMKEVVCGHGYDLLARLGENLIFVRSDQYLNCF